MRARCPRLWRGEDTGASLIFALVFITVVSLVVAAVLGLADASMRSVISHRSVAAESAAAEGAANIAMNALRKSTYTGSGGCFGNTSSLSVPSSELPGPEPVSALVSCTSDPLLAVFPLGAPAQTILTTALPQIALPPPLPPLNDPLPGFALHDVANGPTPPPSGLRVAGNIYSSSRIRVNADANLTAEGAGVAIRAAAFCERPTVTYSLFPRKTSQGTVSPPCTIGTVPSSCPQCATPSVANLESAIPVPVPPCGQPFTPGRYTDLAAINNRTS
jgi:hypothetical protein